MKTPIWKQRKFYITNCKNTKKTNTHSLENIWSWFTSRMIFRASIPWPDSEQECSCFITFVLYVFYESKNSEWKKVVRIIILLYIRYKSTLLLVMSSFPLMQYIALEAKIQVKAYTAKLCTYIRFKLCKYFEGICFQSH